MAKTELGLDQNIEGALCYLFLWITGIIFYILEEDNKFVRFHAKQSIIVFLPLTIFGILFGSFFGFGPFLRAPGWFFLWWIGIVIWFLILILWLILMLKAFKGEKYKLPIVGGIVEDKS
jgi:uncharacterized membrane protein